MKISKTLILFLTVFVLSGGSIEGQTFKWGTTNVFSDWYTGVHWTGGDLIFNPHPDNVNEAAVIQAPIGDSFVSPIMDDHVTIGALTIRPDASLRQNGYTLLINPGNGTSGNTNIQSDGVLVIEGGVYDTNGVTINGFLRMIGGLVQVDDWATIGNQGALTGKGDFNLASASLSNGGIISSNYQGSELRIYGSGAFDWDGSNGNGILSAGNSGGSTNATLRIELPPTDPFDGLIRVNPECTFSSNSDWELADGHLVLDGGLILGGDIEMTSDSSLISAVDGENEIQSSVTMMRGEMKISWTAEPSRLRISGDAEFSEAAEVWISSLSELVVESGTSSAAMLGSGGITKTGSGTFDLSGVISYSGPTTVEAGTLNLFGSLNPLTTLTVDGLIRLDSTQAVSTLNGGGNVVLDGISKLIIGSNGLNSAGEFSGEIQGTGSLSKVGPGTLHLIGNNTYSGQTSVSQGILRIANQVGSGTGPGNLLISSGGSIVIDNGVIMGDLMSVQSGGSVTMWQGRLELNQLKQQDGLFVMTDGRLAVEIVDGDLEIDGGVVGKNDSPTEMTVNGDLELADGSTLEVEVAGTIPGTEFDQLTVNGDLTLGGNLDVQTLPPFILQDAQQFAIIQTQGSVDGQFNGLGDGDWVANIDGIDLFISYQPNAVFLFTESGEQSDPTKIDFQLLEHIDDQTSIHGTQYCEDGFTLETSPSNLASYGVLHPHFSGSTALYCDADQGTTILTKDDRGAFALVSIDLAELNGNDVANVKFQGLTPSGDTTTQTFTIDGVAFGRETFTFNSTFENVTSVSWVQVPPFHQFDNIVFGEAIPPVILGDVNLDGAVNLLDVDPFIERLSTSDFQAEADCNQDGVVNLLDVDPFIVILSGG